MGQTDIIGFGMGNPLCRDPISALPTGPGSDERAPVFVGKLAALPGDDRAQARRRLAAGAEPMALPRCVTEPAEVAALAAYASSQRAAATIGAALRAEGGVISSMC